MIKCECSERIGSVINSYQLYEEIKMFFEEQVKEGRFSEVPVEKPYCNGFEWKADKWYKCMDVFGNLNILISQQKVLSVSLLMEYITRRR